MIIRSPDESIINGYDIHLVFSTVQEEKASQIFTAFLAFVEAHDIPCVRPKLFKAPVGPWPSPMWQVLLPPSARVYTDLGRCISWLMLNRSDFSVMVHPNSRKEQGLGGDYEDHSQNMLWLGPSVPLRMEIFQPKG